MKIENLHEGMVIKNYKEFCELLGIIPKRGNSKNSQIKEINTYLIKRVKNEVIEIIKNKLKCGEE